jgi:hypothetical protein
MANYCRAVTKSLRGTVTILNRRDINHSSASNSRDTNNTTDANNSSDARNVEKPVGESTPPAIGAAADPTARTPGMSTAVKTTGAPRTPAIAETIAGTQGKPTAAITSATAIKVSKLRTAPPLMRVNQ